jgi:hypothetical protein
MPESSCEDTCCTKHMVMDAVYLCTWVCKQIGSLFMQQVQERGQL